MRIFLSYRFTGEDPDILHQTLIPICANLSQAGHDVYCSLFDPTCRSNNVDEIYTHCLEKLSEHETLLAFVNSSSQSKGIELEIDFAQKAGKKVILAIHTTALYPKVRQAAHEIIEFQHVSQLLEVLPALELK